MAKQTDNSNDLQKETHTRSWKSTSGRMWGMPISLIAIWATLVVAASALPALPVPGMGGVITVSAFLTAISGIILGPVAAVANGIGGIISLILFPFGSLYGPLSFLPALIGGLTSGLLFINRWKWAGLIQLLVILAWFSNPSTWSDNMWIVVFPFPVIGLIVIFVKPVRMWARGNILSMDKVKFLPAMLLVVIVGHSSEFLTSNVLANTLFTLRWQYWVPTWPYWTGVSVVILVLSTFVGVAVVKGLRRAKLPNAADILNI